MEREIPPEVIEIERRAHAAGVPIAAILRRADVAASQWVRWKNRQQTPLRTTMARVVRAADDEIAAKSNGGQNGAPEGK